MKIAVDAMGGDYAPSVVIEGVTAALYDFPDCELTIVGHLGKIAYYLEKYGIEDHPRIKTVHAEEVVDMGEPSAVAIRSKRNSSITVCAKLLRDRQVEAIVSAGHTGASVVSTKVIVKMLPGIERPAIAAILPAQHGRFVLIDAGANTDCDAFHLGQFAIMGEAYAKYILGLERPRIGLLSVGGEDIKGNGLTKEAFKLLSSMKINFIGNVEGDTIFENAADVVVCDGFLGNVLLKGSEGLAKAIMHWMKDIFSKNPMRLTGAMLARSAFKELKEIGDAEELGGAPLLGIKGVCVIGHGSSTPKSVRNAIKVASDFVRFGINEKITSRIIETDMMTTSTPEKDTLAESIE